MSYDGNPSFKIKPTAPEALRSLFEDCDEDSLIIVGNATDGAMTTIGLFEDFELNPCHLNSDGTITRYCQQIATIDDIDIEHMP